MALWKQREFPMALRSPASRSQFIRFSRPTALLGVMFRRRRSLVHFGINCSEVLASARFRRACVCKVHRAKPTCGHFLQASASLAQEETSVRFVYFGLIVVFIAIVALFKFQNLESATVSLLAFSVTLPTSILVMVIYVLGMLTGGFVVALLRTWVSRASGND
jgi:lipopolysaccharide assembly protein A